MFWFFKFYLSALPSLPLASLSEHSLPVSFLALLLATVKHLPICRRPGVPSPVLRKDQKNAKPS
jgi:hypothetical protein